MTQPLEQETHQNHNVPCTAVDQDGKPRCNNPADVLMLLSCVHDTWGWWGLCSKDTELRLFIHNGISCPITVEMVVSLT